ncbi:MAG: hypothetical protein ACHQHP_01145 [Bacteroidia bacterium]
MKFAFLIGILLLSPFVLKAQDTLVKRNGEKLIVKLVEVNPTDIRYKRFDYQEGPLFTLPKEEIKFIIYANGAKESFESYVPPVAKEIAPDLSIQSTGKYYYYKGKKVREADMLDITGKLGDKKTNLAIKKTENIKFLQEVTLIGGIGVFVTGWYIYLSNFPRRVRRGYTGTTSNASRLQAQKNGEYLMLGALGSEIVSIGLRFDRRRHAHIVMDLYNKAIIH